MNYGSLMIGLGSFLIIGIFHPIVIKAEYYFGKQIWPVFLISAILVLLSALLVKQMIGSALLSVLGFTLLWSIKELFEQERRVERGWFPANPHKTLSKINPSMTK